MPKIDQNLFFYVSFTLFTLCELCHSKKNLRYALVECNHWTPILEKDMTELPDNDNIISALNSILEAELSGVVRYTHYSLMITGPNRIPLVDFMKSQATESLVHAQEVGEILTGFGGHPSTTIADIEETHQHSIRNILTESLTHERETVLLYQHLLETVDGTSVFLEEFARTMIATEEQHQLELSKMLRDYAGEE